MAKKIAQQAPLTPAEEARQKAATVVELDAKIKDLKAQSDALKTELTAYVTETGNTDLGELVAQKKTGKPAIDFGTMTAKQKQFALEGLLKELPEFAETTTELNVEKMFFSLSTNPAIGNALKVRGLQIVEKETVAFVKPKA